MHITRRILLCLAALILLGLVLFPPWSCNFDAQGRHISRSWNYNWIWSPPYGVSDNWSVRIDTTRLGLEILAVLLASGVAWIVLPGRRS